MESKDAELTEQVARWWTGRSATKNVDHPVLVKVMNGGGILGRHCAVYAEGGVIGGNCGIRVQSKANRHLLVSQLAGLKQSTQGPLKLYYELSSHISKKPDDVIPTSRR